MKVRRLYLLVMMLILCSRLVRAQEPLKQRDDLGKPTERTDDSLLKQLRSLLKKPGLDKVSDILAKSKEMTVTRGQSGQLRVLIGHVSGEILKTKIKLVTFTPIARYNAEDALIPILRAREVQATMRKLGIEQPMTVSPGIRQEPNPRLPHLPASMKNVSMDEAFDRVAQTFGGIIIYGEWTIEGTRLFSADFVSMSYLEELMRKGR